MKNLIAFAFALFFIGTTYAANNVTHKNNLPPVSRTVKLRAGTLIIFQLSDNIEATGPQVGNIIQLKVRKNVMVDGNIVISANAMALGRITEVKEATATSGGHIKFEVRDVQAVDGQMVNLNATYQFTSKGPAGESTGADTSFNITAHTMDDEYISVN